MLRMVREMAGCSSRTGRARRWSARSSRVIRSAATEGEERDRLYAMVSGAVSEYEKNTGRVFPVRRQTRTAYLTPLCGASYTLTSAIRPESRWFTGSALELARSQAIRHPKI
jgi:hypothetical protein